MVRLNEWLFEWNKRTHEEFGRGNGRGCGERTVRPEMRLNWGGISRSLCRRIGFEGRKEGDGSYRNERMK